MHGGSRHGSRGQARSVSRSAGGRGASGRPGPGKASAKGAGDGPAARAESGRTQAPLPDPDRISGLLEPVIHALGMDLESVRVTAAGRRRLLRVIVDADGGVSLDDIAFASRELSARLDGASIMGEMPYTLEVSSPGVDRPLTEARHWRRATGRMVIAPLAGPTAHRGGNGQARVEGRIVGVTAQGVTLDCDGVLREYRYTDLGPGRVQVEFGHLDQGADADADADDELDDEPFDEDAGEED
jgi:ribosome maturation factor RimP